MGIFNIIDLAVLGVLALFLLSGLYRGFLATLMTLASYLCAFVLAFAFMSAGANAVKHTESLYGMMLYYTEGSEFISDTELVHTDITTLGSDQINGIVSSASLPYPMGKRIAKNIAEEAFVDQNITTLGDYFNQTIVCVFINILVFLFIFLVVRIVFAFVLNGIDYARSFPVLQGGDGLIGAGLGLVHGIFALFLLFMLLPILLTVLGNFEFITSLVSRSLFADFFYRSNFLLSLIPGT